MVLLNKILAKFVKESSSPGEVLLSYRYQCHNQRRLQHLASLGLNFTEATVFELGAGIGDHNSFLIDRGYKFVSSDARRDNVKISGSRYPDIKLLRLDLDDPPKRFDQVFDITYACGVLYHLKNPGMDIKFMANCCQRVLLLETCVSYGDQNLLCPVDEDRSNPRQSYAGIDCRPTRLWVYDHLKRYFEFVYLPIT